MPIGVFDSGVGGLSVAAEIAQKLPGGEIVYVGDSLHAPYGPRSPEEIQGLSAGLTRFLLSAGCAPIVLACNTATAAAIEHLRATFPEVSFVGMEPAVKPAARATRSGIVGVLATVGTLESARFAALLTREGGKARFLARACPGWVEAVERGALEAAETRRLVESVVLPLLEEGADTLVLGCTHFPALRPLIAHVAGPGVALIDTGEAVARRVASLVPSCGLAGEQGGLTLFTTGDSEAFSGAARAILGREPPPVARLLWKERELFDAESGWAGQSGPAPGED